MGILQNTGSLVFVMIFWLVTHSEIRRTSVLAVRVAGSEARGVSRVLGLHNGSRVRVHSHHAGLREGHDVVGPGSQNVGLVGVDGCQDVEEVALLVVVPGHGSSLAWLAVVEVRVRVGCAQAIVEASIVEDIGVRCTGHH